MGIIFLIIFFNMFRKLKVDNQRSDRLSYWIVGFIIFSIFSSVIPFSFPLGILALIAFSSKCKKERRSREARSNNYQGSWNSGYDFHQNPNMANVREPLPQSPKKRRKIIRVYNEMYNLCLTEEQITSIVNASYVSELWRNEIHAMTKKYEVVYEWFNGPLNWLRVYLYVFKIQEVVGDMDEQEHICAYAFDEIMKYSDSLGSMPLAMKIKYINDKYFTNFDDTTYMIAFRFLESRGIKHANANPNVVNKNSEIDELMKKYKTSEQRGQH